MSQDIPMTPAGIVLAPSQSARALMLAAASAVILAAVWIFQGLGYALSEVCFTGPAERLTATDVCQPALVATALAAFRVAQEALTNIERHAQASEVRIVLTSSGGGAQLLIEDNGRGFADRYGKGRSGGLGLRNMQKRMEHFGGSLDVRTSPRGTTLRARLPKSIYLTNKVEPVPA